MLGLLQSRVVVIPEVFRGFRYTEMLAGLRRDVPEVEHVFVARGEPAAGMQAWATLTDTAWESREGRRPLPGGDPNHVHEVVFTSGTTGEPKGVMHTPNTTLSTIYSVIDRLGFSERDVILMASTLGHQTGYLYGYCLKHRHPARGARGRQEAPLLLSKVPARRIGEPEEVGPLAVYLASAASDFMTGQTVYLDGGQTIAW